MVRNFTSNKSLGQSTFAPPKRFYPFGGAMTEFADFLTRQLNATASE
jgi:hypothetical protein